MRFVTTFLLAFTALMLQVLLSPVIAILDAKIDFIMILVVSLGFFSKQWYAAPLTGLYTGIALDTLTQGVTFINTGIYFAIGLLVVAAAALMHFAQHPIVTGLTVFGATCLKFFSLVFILYIRKIEPDASLVVFARGLPTALYTAVMAAGLFYFYRWLYSWDFMSPIQEEKPYIEK